MAEFTGYASGVAEGMKESVARQSSYDVHQERIQQLAMRSQEMAIKDREQEQAFQERQLMSRAFSTKTFDKNAKEDYNTQNGLANKFIQAGQSLMSINPKRGLDLIKEGEDLQHKGAEDQLKTMQLVNARHEAIGQASLAVKDQASLNDSVQELAQANIIVPSKYRVWNEETKDWFSQRAKGTQVVQKATKLDLDVEAQRLAKRKEARQTYSALISDKQKERKAALERSGKDAPIKEQSVDGTTMTIQELSDVSSEFSDMPPGQKILAAKDYYRRANAYVQSGVTDKNVAFSKARQDIIGSIKEGQYKGLTSTGITADSSKATPTQADRDYVKQHPELLEKFKEHFGVEP